MQTLWAETDTYFEALLVEEAPVLRSALDASKKAGLPDIAVSPSQGKFLHLLTRIKGARTVLEIGTLGGYSTIWMARALPEGGRLVTLEYEQTHADIARANLQKAGLDGLVDIRVGAALETLPELEAEQAGPFDLIFIDADKPNNPHYLTWSLKLSRPGTVIVADNVVRDGAVLDTDSDDENVRGIRRFSDMVAAEPRLDATVIQTTGCKGHDGFMLAVVTG